MIYVITGKSATGKTTLAMQLKKTLNCDCIHTDSYIKYGREWMYERMMEDIRREAANGDVIVEGIDAMKLITKYNLHYDKLDVLHEDMETRRARHLERGTEINPGQDTYFDNLYATI